MSYYSAMEKEALLREKSIIEEKIKKYQGMGLDLNMARGKPCKEQLDISNGMIDGSIDFSIDIDYRNYGILDGIKEVKAIYSELMNVTKEELIIGGNSSLNLMYDNISKAMLLGTVDSERPWVKCEKVKFICPAPGYDRHFTICESLGIEMITVALNDDGPDMDQVERLVSEDESIKGMWAVPKYSNPTGMTYSDEVVDRLATMKTAAKDFRIFWDNAYMVHHLEDRKDELKDMLQACKDAGNANRVYMFTSTSKITYPGAGISMMAMSKANADFLRGQMNFQTIGSNKVNQLMHARFLPSVTAVTEHMKKHSAIIAPKFDIVIKVLDQYLSDKGIASYAKPNGGYFISLEVEEGCAKEVVSLCKSCGVTLTPAGATFPYGKDPKDSNIRIAPTFPPLSELELAIEILATCVLYASINKAIAQ